MKNACSGAPEQDDIGRKEAPYKHVTLPNGKKSNGAEQNSISKEHTTNKTSRHSIASTESCSGDNEEEKKAITLKESRNCLPPLSRRSSRLQGKQPKLTEIITTSDEEENLESEDDLPDKGTKRRKGKSIGNIQKKQDQPLTSTNSPDVKPRLKVPAKEKKSKKEIAASKLPKEFSSGSFVVIKSDFHSTTTPAIWRIDGKALLQKYVHFDQDGQIMYKNTSTYSGWTLNNKDQYYPAEVDIKSQKRNETIVKFKRELIIADDSD